MSDLVYQNYNNKCQGWVNPSNILFGPQIISLSGYKSPAGSSTVVAINGTNFFSYSTIQFGTFTPTVYFINSNLLQFYVPNTLSSGTFPVQVCNGSVCSNIVNYTIDNASGYWLLNSNGSITNTNTNGVGVSWLSRGILLPILVNNGLIGTYANPFEIPNNKSWIICDVSLNDIFLNLPEGTQFTGREIMIKRIGGNAVLTNIGLVKSFNNQDEDNIIMSSNPAATNYNYSWVTLVYDGSIWQTMQAA